MPPPLPVSPPIPEPSRATLRLVRTCATGVGVLAFASLEAWWGGNWRVLVFAHSAPIPPSTALLLLLLSATLWWLPHGPGARAGAWLAWLAAGITAVVTGSVVRGHFLHLLPVWEDRLTGGEVPTGAGAAVGHMSIFTAEMLLLATVSLLALHPPLTRMPFARRAGPLAAGLAGGLALFGLLLQLTGVVSLQGTDVVPVAVITLVALVLLSLALSLASGTQTQLRRLLVGAEGGAPGDRRREYLVWSTLIGVGLLSIGGGILYLQMQQSSHRKLVADRVAAIATGKAERLQAWHLERQMDADQMAEAMSLPFFRTLFTDELRHPNRTDELSQWLQQQANHDRFQSITLLDSHLRPILALPADSGPPPALQALFPPLAATSQITDLPPWLDNAGQVHLDQLIPLRILGDPLPYGALLVRFDSLRLRQAALIAWSKNSETAETVLWWCDGKNLRCLGTDRQGAASAHTQTITRVEVRPNAAARALATQIAQGRFTAVESVDFRGQDVLSSLRLVPGTPWLVECKVDEDEVYALLRHESWWVGLALAGIIVATGLALRLAGRRRQQEQEHRQLQAELERSLLAERLGLVLRHASDAIFLLTPDGQILESNERAWALYGYSAAELGALNLNALRGLPDPAPPPRPSTPPPAATEAGYIFETWHRHSNGTVFPVEISSREVVVGGRPHTLSIVRDITERKGRENQLARLTRLHRMLHRLLEGITRNKTPEAIFAIVCHILTDDGFEMAWIGAPTPQRDRLRLLAKAGLDYGYAEQLVIPLGDHPADRGPCGAAFQEARTVICNDLRNASRTGPWQDATRPSGLRSCIALPLRQRGLPTGLLTVYAAEKGYFGPQEIELLQRAADNLSFALDALAGEERRRAAEVEMARQALDITERKKLEAALAGALAKEREASQMKTRFITVTSHEFRTPLSAALGSIELLANHMDQLAPEKRVRVVQRIRESLLNMEGLVQEILTLSRAESGRLKVQLAEVNLAELADEVIEELRAADRDAHPFEWQVPSDLVCADRSILRHILTNLAGNAVRYSPPGTTVTVRAEIKPQGYRLLVRDRGMGIPLADQARIFEPFERGSNIGTIRGTGLGLNIVVRLAEELGGKIGLASEEGQGSIFTVEFPLPPPPPRSLVPGSGAHPGGGG